MVQTATVPIPIWKYQNEKTERTTTTEKDRDSTVLCRWKSFQPHATTATATTDFPFWICAFTNFGHRISLFTHMHSLFVWALFTCIWIVVVVVVVGNSRSLNRSTTRRFNSIRFTQLTRRLRLNINRKNEKNVMKESLTWLQAGTWTHRWTLNRSAKYTSTYTARRDYCTNNNRRKMITFRPVLTETNITSFILIIKS